MLSNVSKQMLAVAALAILLMVATAVGVLWLVSSHSHPDTIKLEQTQAHLERTHVALTTAETLTYQTSDLHDQLEQQIQADRGIVEQLDALAGDTSADAERQKKRLEAQQLVEHERTQRLIQQAHEGASALSGHLAQIKAETAAQIAAIKAR